MYLMARHGTRWPTADRLAQMEGLESLFKVTALRVALRCLPAVR